MAESTNMIRLDNVTYRYGEEGIALKSVSLNIEKGEMLAIVGHNGSGKSTLAKHLNALLLPTEGSVTVEGMDTKDPDNTLNIRKKVGMVFQNPDNQLVTTIVEEDVAFGPENLGIPSAEIRERVNKALEAVGMTEYANAAPHMLSGGQKQRIAIAGMLAMKPEVLVLDESTAMLDPQGRQEVLEIVSRVNKEYGMTVVMITQYMEEAVMADRVAVMKGGELIMTGTPKEVFSRGEELRSHGLDLPAIARLRDELIAGGMDIPKDAITAQELADAICR
ncbi:MAG: energy-coupling factor transporter ATPase [Clostridia bacterium]|nr:energy-coupling factor transporter ATPase [Clostridia bacterium]